METIKLFHRIVGLVYLIAFVSYYVQFPGLNGYNGLEPVSLWADLVKENILSIDQFSTVGGRFLVYINDTFGFPAEAVCEICLWIGLISSIQIMFGQKPRSVFFATAWLSYSMLIEAGNLFYSFQWDILLQECGFLCFLSTLFQCSQISTWCYRFLAWKLLFLSGVVKLQAKCPTWENLSALEYHFATQPLPTPFAWFFHQLPPIVLRLSVAATLVIEIPFSFLLISPLSYLRRVGVVLQIFLQCLILLTGNYNFFNLLTIALMLPSWANDNYDDHGDDHDKIHTGETENNEISPVGIHSITTLSNTNTIDNLGNHLHHNGVFVSYLKSLKIIEQRHTRVSYILLNILFLLPIIWMFDLAPPHPSSENYTSDNSNSYIHYFHWRGDQILLRQKWDSISKYMLPASLVAIAICCLHAFAFYALKLHTNYYHTYTTQTSKNDNNKTYSFGIKLTKIFRFLLFLMKVFWNTLHICVALAWILTSSIGLTGICNLTPYIPPIFPVMFNKAQSMHMMSSYGLFRVMTGKGPDIPSHTDASLIYPTVSRPEIVLEGLDAITNKWVEIPFKYKPGNLSAMPTFIAPYQPRLDWQMWFAALGGYGNNPWFVTLISKLLAVGGNKNNVKSNKNKKFVIPPEVIAILDADNFAFNSTNPPAAVRAWLYEYDFTRLNTSWNRDNPGVNVLPVGPTGEGESRGDWWIRRNRREYLMAVRADNLIDYINSRKMNRPYKSPIQQYENCVRKSQHVFVSRFEKQNSTTGIVTDSSTSTVSTSTDHSGGGVALVGAKALQSLVCVTLKQRKDFAFPWHDSYFKYLGILSGLVLLIRLMTG